MRLLRNKAADLSLWEERYMPDQITQIWCHYKDYKDQLGISYTAISLRVEAVVFSEQRFLKIHVGVARAFIVPTGKARSCGLV